MFSDVSSEECTDCPVLLNELWIRSFSYLSEKDLLALGQVSRNFLIISSTDDLWKVICNRRWKGKQNVKRFMKKEGGEGINDGRVTYCTDFIKQLYTSSTLPALFVRHAPKFITIEALIEGGFIELPAINMDSLMHTPTSWKESYIMAEIDSKRTKMSKEELVHFKWKLIYDGRPSVNGLRQFNADGTYHSPYMGLTNWELEGNIFSFAGSTLFVERDANTWGWIIGKNERTMYRSVDENDIEVIGVEKSLEDLYRRIA